MVRSGANRSIPEDVVRCAAERSDEERERGTRVGWEVTKPRGDRVEHAEILTTPRARELLSSGCREVLFTPGSLTI